MHLYSKQQLFDEWVELERADTSWLATIPDCPDKICVVNGQPKDCNNGQWESIDEADQQYHKGAKWCMRSNTYRGAGQQCCYDKDGKLITDGTGAGTPDRYAPAVLNGIYLMHYIHDVVPYYYALELDGDEEAGPHFLKYLQARPPSKGGGSCYK